MNLQHGFIRLAHTQSGKPRAIPLNETVQKALTGLRTRIDVPWVFHDEDGRPFRDTRHKFEWACKRAGIVDFHFHDLRHTFASWLVMGGVPLVTVSKLLGHEKVTMTMRYAHISSRHMKRAVRVLDGQGCKPLDNYLTNGGFQGRSEVDSLAKFRT